jgi:hypothetical protein
MMEENERRKESSECKYCKALTDITIQVVLVGDRSITTSDIALCKTCKQAFDDGYEMGVRDT